ncbi:hypothetical protein D9619_011516 [Psilocybe cf. subviscida]|uniref:F-box domain-containing protein n=1 Tax=Psilocybe cf. subviscida TaxID=2480587 RepID=A0A8H5F9G4_9AGAR|nr:hypothetical protein D9619_011516 [Psilocybe cf. subviscida]
MIRIGHEGSSIGQLSMHLSKLFRTKEAPSPLSHLLHSNLPPSDDDAALVREALRKLEKEAAIDTKRADLIRQHKAILSLVRVLPTEIIQHIFIFASDTPWTISQVCRSWRHSAIALSGLWSRLPYMVLQTSSSKTRVQIALLSELLRRSRNAPLRISVSTSRRAIKNRQARTFHAHPVLRLLTAHSQRWQAVKLHLPETVVANLGADIRGKLDELTVLALNMLCSSHSDTNNGIAEIDTFALAPRLRSVDIKGMYSAEFKLPVANLVHYTHDIRSPLRLEEFASSSALETFDLSYRGTLVSSSNALSITLANLTNLTLESYFSSHRSFLVAIDLPAVQDIHVTSGSENLLPDLLAMLTRSGSGVCLSLRRLYIRTGAPPAQGDLVALLQAAPGLEHLNTTVPFYQDIEALGRTGSIEDVLAPRLKTCSFHLDRFVSDEVRLAIRRAAAARCEGRASSTLEDTELVEPLEHFEVQSAGGLRTEWVESADGEEGAEVEVWTPILQQVFFEAWTPTAAFPRVWALKMRLYAEIPTLHLWRVSRPKISDFGWTKRIEAILTQVEELEILDPRDILISNFHILLQTLNKDYLGNGVNYAFFNHAERILTKWKPLIATCLHDLHWGFRRKSHSSLTYIPSDHPIRRSEHMLEAVIHGISNGSDLFSTHLE